MFRLEGVGGTSTGTFRAVGESTVRGTKFYALYNGEQTTATKTVTLGGTQAQEGDGVCNIASGIAPMAAYTEGASPDYAKAFNFQNLCGIMALSLTADADVRLAKLNFVGGNNLSGSGTVTFSGDNIENTKASLVLNSATSTSLTRDCSIDMVKGETYTVYVVVPAGEYRYLSVDAYISSDPTKPVLSRRRQGTGNAAFTINTGGITRVANFNVKTVAPHVYAVGDVYPYDAVDADGHPIAGETAKGIVFQVSADGLSGKIVTINPDQTNTYVFSTLSEVPIDGDYPVSESNTVLNMRAVATYPTGSFPVFDAVAALNTDGHDKDDESLSWYLPAIEELITIVGQKSNLDDTYRTYVNGTARTSLMATTYKYWSSTGDFDFETGEPYGKCYFYGNLSGGAAGQINKAWQYGTFMANVSGRMLPISGFKSK